jgi:hypothetical protein
VIDGFPFLVKASPSLPSIIQREFGPGGSGQRSSVRRAGTLPAHPAAIDRIRRWISVMHDR